MAETISHGWKYRIYPTKEQQMRFELAFAATDYIYDTLLRICNRYHKRFVKPFDKKIKRIKYGTRIDKDGNPVIDKKTGEPKFGIRSDAELTSDELAKIKALRAQRKYFNIRRQKFVKRIVPITFDRNGDPWLSYVTKQADGSEFPDWMPKRRLTKIPSVGRRDPNGIRYLATSSLALNDAVNRLNTAFSNSWSPKLPARHPTFTLTRKQRDAIAERLLRANPDLIEITDREIYQEAIRSEHRSFAFQVQAANGPIPILDMFIDDTLKRVKLPGIPEDVKIRIHRIPQGNCTHATISRDADGKWFLSFTCTDIPLYPATPAPKKEAACEIGIAHYLVCSDGTEIEHPAQLKAIQKRIDEERAILARKKGGHQVPKRDKNGNIVYYKKGKRAGEPVMVFPPRSKAYWKQKKIVSALEAKQRRIRQHNLHLITQQLTDTYETTYIRDNDVKDMLANESRRINKLAKQAKTDPSIEVPDREMFRTLERNLHRAIADSSFFEFRRQMEYKSEWKHRDILKAPTRIPTTQACCECGELNPDLAGVQGLTIREWTCPKCNTHHDREENSAANILAWAHGAQYMTKYDVPTT